MTGSRRIVTIALALSLIIPGSAMTLNVDPAHGQNAVDRFFGRIGNAFRGKRTKQDRAVARKSDPARRGAHFDVETRKKIQARLNELGFKVGPVDGIFGRGTQRGITEYQKSIGEKPTAILTKDQADRLLAVQTPEADVAGGGKDSVPAPGETVESQISAEQYAVCNSLAVLACKAEELLDCMARFGAPETAVAFVNALSETKIEPGPLVYFDSFGRVDMGEIGYPWNEQKSTLVLLNGGPAAIATETDRLPAITIDGPAYRKLLNLHQDLFLVGRPVLRSHRLTASGGQRFVFAYRLASCDGCMTPGEVLIGYDFEADGRYQGVKLLGVWSRDPGTIWPGTAQLSVDILMNDQSTVRRRLAGLGFEVGEAESEDDNEIGAALAAFQKDHGLPGDGEINTKTAMLLAAPEIGIEINRFDQIYRATKTPDRFDEVLEIGIGLLGRAERRSETGGVALARLNSRIARLYLRNKEPGNALPYAEKAVSISETAYRQPDPIRGLYLVSLGETYLALGDKGKAAGRFAAALDIFQELTVVGPMSRRELAAKSFMRTGNKLIDLHEKMGNPQAGAAIQERLDAVEREMAAAQ